MITIHIYGFLKKKFDPNASLADQTFITVPHIQNESFKDLLERLKVEKEDIGDCFVNGTVVSNANETIIPDNSRVALFGAGMRLLCGGQHLKGHGYVEEPAPDLNYF